MFHTRFFLSFKIIVQNYLIIKKINKLTVSIVCSCFQVLIDIQHCLLKSLGVSHKRLEEIIECCAHTGLHAKLTGAGGGGFAFALISPSTPEHVSDKVTTALYHAGFVADDIVANSEGVALDIKSI